MPAEKIVAGPVTIWFDKDVPDANRIAFALGADAPSDGEFLVRVDSERWASGVLPLKNNAWVGIPNFGYPVTVVVCVYDGYGVALSPPTLLETTSMGKARVAPRLPAAGQPKGNRATGAIVLTALIVAGGGVWWWYQQDLKLTAQGDRDRQELQKKLETANQETAAALVRARQATAEAERARAQVRAQKAEQERAKASSNPESVTRNTAPPIRIGDQYTYETNDLLEPALSNVTSREVVSVDNGIYTLKLVNQKGGYTRMLRYTADWSYLGSIGQAGESVVFDPPLKYFQFPMVEGTTWEQRSVERNTKSGKTREFFVRARVGGGEQVTVPAGTFEAVKITLATTVREGDTDISTGTDVSWYAPSARRSVKSLLESTQSDSGKRGQRVIQLLSYKLN